MKQQLAATVTSGMYTHVVLLSVASFLLAMALTPVYTYLAYRYRFWKKQRQTSTTGEALEVFTKLHANKFKRSIPTMAGAIAVVVITVVTFAFNLDRSQTWLPLAALVGGGAVGLLDDIINIRVNGSFATADILVSNGEVSGVATSASSTPRAIVDAQLILPPDSSKIVLRVCFLGETPSTPMTPP
jgi:hypothetical protein